MGEQFTRWTIRLALLLAVGALVRAKVQTPQGESTNRSIWPSTRVLWTAACLFYLAHVACAFHFVHGWSQAAAYRQTALTTAAFTGIDWGGGLYFNYLFSLLWLGDVLWWWLWPASFSGRAGWVATAWHGFFAFMAFNGAVVFAEQVSRLFGLALAAIALAAVLGRRKPVQAAE